MVGMPIPRTRETSSSGRATGRGCATPMSSTKSAKLDAAPVSVRTPMMTPTIAQARPDADRLARAVDQAAAHDAQCFAAARVKKFDRVRTTMSRDDAPDLHPVEASVARPRSSRTRLGTAVEWKPATMPAPRISTAVRASPTSPDTWASSRRTEDYEHHERQHQVPLLDDRAPRIRALRLRKAEQSGASGLEVHHPEGGDVVEESRGSSRP